MMIPVVQDLAIELAVSGVSYRQASDALEKILGYTVISHEGIRQQLLNTEITPKEKQKVDAEVIFVEVDGLYTKSQKKEIGRASCRERVKKAEGAAARKERKEERR